MKGISLALVVSALLLFVSGSLYAATSDCADGTKYFKCSTKSPGYLCGTSGLMLYVDMCPCTAVPGYVQQGTGETATCILAKCSDGTEAGQCSPTKPKMCAGGGLVDNATKCGCQTGRRASANGLNCEFIPCNDGGVTVPDGTCSAKKEKKCVNGQLVDKASECGCPAGETRVGESCAVICEDSTQDGQCSATKPKECVNGYLIDNAAKCGCPEGKIAVGKQCADNVLSSAAGADLLGGSTPSGNGTAQGASGSANALSCCCLPAALIGIAGGFAAFRKK